LAPVPIPLTDADAAVIDGRLFVVGGKTGDNGGVATKALHIYDPTGGWLPGPPKDDAATALEDQAVVAANGHLYVIGGSTGAFATFKDEVWVYTPGGENLDTGTWTEGPSLPVALSGATAVVHEGEIWVIGGMDGTTGGTSRDEVLVLSGLDPGDPAQGTWSLDESLNQARDNAGAAVLDGKIHVFGGRERVEGTTIHQGLASYEVLSGGTWNLVDAAGEFVGRRSFVVGTLNGDAQIMGGESPVQDANQNFDAQTGVWTTLEPLVPARHGAAYATIGATVYIVGGSTEVDNHTDLVQSFTLP
jgi:N-acetylneuraminic acid mutarotase